MPMSVRRLLGILRKEHWDPRWWPGDTPFEISVGAILTQNTAWVNVEKAIDNLKKRNLLTPEGMLSVSRSQLEHAVYPSGFYRQKSRYLAAFSKFVVEKYNGDIEKMKRVPTEKMRLELLEIPGIGRETADEILLYALGKPSFVVDAYTRRLLRRLGMNLGTSYDSIKTRFETELGGSVKDYADMHALIVMHCKVKCTKTLPTCDECPLNGPCPSKSRHGKRQ